MKPFNKLVVLALCWLFASFSAPLDSPPTTANVNISTPGTLKDNIPDATSLTQLTVTGNIDARDFAFMRDDMPNLAVLDLDGTTIVAYGGPDGTVSGNVSYLVNEMPQSSFYNNSTGTGKSSLTSIVLPNGVTSIREVAFAHCSSLKNVSLPTGLNSIRDNAFQNCSSLTNISLPDSLNSIGERTFQSCSLKDIILPVGLNSIGNWAFEFCYSLESVTFPDSLYYSIGFRAFNDCSSLKNIILPAGLTSIGNETFRNCSSLESITNLNSVPLIIDSNVFEAVSKSNCILKVPSSSVLDYRNAAVWGNFDYIIEAGVTYFRLTTSNNVVLGAVSGTPNGLYPENTTVSLEATPANGYDFLAWTSKGNTLSLELEYSFTLASDTTITAVFRKAGSYNLTSAGTLKNIEGIEDITHLTLTGNIDARDIKFMRDNMSYLAELDLSGATVVAYSGPGGTVSWIDYYPANEMPVYSFYNEYTYTGKISLILYSAIN
jgi:hypothetical protein